MGRAVSRAIVALRIFRLAITSKTNDTDKDNENPPMDNRVMEFVIVTWMKIRRRGGEGRRRFVLSCLDWNH